jgi:methionyl-tRNA formyltransferase
LDKLEKGRITPQKQDDCLSSYAPMFNNENRKINWNLPAKNIHNLIRGLSPWPTAYFTMDEKTIKVHKSSDGPTAYFNAYFKLDEKKIKVYKSSYTNDNSDYEPGYVIKVNNEGIFIKAKDGIVILKEIQMPGKKKMTVEAYLRGNKLPEKIVLN